MTGAVARAIDNVASVRSLAVDFRMHLLLLRSRGSVNPPETRTFRMIPKGPRTGTSLAQKNSRRRLLFVGALPIRCSKVAANMTGEHDRIVIKMNEIRRGASEQVQRGTLR